MRLANNEDKNYFYNGINDIDPMGRINLNKFIN